MLLASSQKCYAASGRSYQMMEGMGCLQLNALEVACFGAKLRPNISLGACPASFRPASLATIAALSLMCSMLSVSVHSLRHSCCRLCFDLTSMSHFWNRASLSLVLSFFSILLLSISLSRCRAFGLLKALWFSMEKQERKEGRVEYSSSTLMEGRRWWTCLQF